MRRLAKIFAAIFTVFILLSASTPALAVEYGRYGDFSYKIDGKTLSVFYYRGLDSKVTVPSKVDGKNVDMLGASLFSYNLRITSVTMGNGIRTIGNYAFGNAKSLRSVSLPDSVTDLGSSAFMNCSALQSVKIPSKIRHIANFTFDECTSLKSVTLPQGLVTIGMSAFENCISLKSVNFPGTLKEIDNWAFEDCSSLNSILLPSSLQRIGTMAFSGCTNLKSVTILPGLRTIDNFAFDECPNLTKVYIPATVTKMGYFNIFSDSPRLTIYAPAGSYAQSYATRHGIKFIASDSPVKIGTVGGIKGSAAGTTGLKLSWNGVQYATGYEVQYASGNAKPKSVFTKAASANISSLKAGTKYSIKVRAYLEASGKKYYGDFSPAVTLGTAAPPPAKPAAVTGLKASSPAYDSVKLEWKAVAGAAGYEVSYSTDNKNFSAPVSQKGTSYIKTRLITGKKYYFKVRAYKMSGKSRLWGSYAAASYAPALPAVRGLKAKAAGKNTVNITWTKTTGASGYEIFAGTTLKNIKKIGEQPNGAKTSYTHSKLRANTAYYYKVRPYRIVSGKRVYGALTKETNACTLK